MKLVPLLILLLLSGCAAETALEINVSYNDGVFSVTSIEKLNVTYIPNSWVDENIYELKNEHDSADDYFLLALLSEGDILHSFHKQYPPLMFYDEIDPDTGQLTGGVIVLNRTNNSYLIPYFEEAESFGIADNDGNVVYTADISMFLEGEEPSLAEPEVEARGPRAEEPNLLFWGLIVLLIVLVAYMVFNGRFRK